jgi:enoyl-CoA hydratase
MSYERILCEKVEPNIVKITMNRPEKRNAIDDLMVEELTDAFVKTDFDDDVRVIILAGAGKDFSAGYDISGKGSPAREPILSAVMQTKLTGMEKTLKITDYLTYNQALTIRDVSKPTIAMVQGNCIAAGLLYASICDLIVASDDAQFIDPLSRWAHAGFEILIEPYLFGFRKAKEVMWTGDPVSAKEAKEFGMVSRVVPKDKLGEETIQLARKIAKTLPVAASLVKRSVNDAWDLMGLKHAWRYHLLAHELSHVSDEAKRWDEMRAQAMQAGGLKEVLKTRDDKYKK